MSVNIRSIQHYMYCPRRYGLIAINTDWAENAFVAKGELVHKRVDDKRHAGKSPDKVFASSVAVYNDDLDIYGVLDCVEFEKCKNGVEIPNLDGKYKVKIVEYKPTRPKNGEIRLTDAIQVFAQKVCGDYIWGCDCECYLYYDDVRRRVRLPFATIDAIVCFSCLGCSPALMGKCADNGTSLSFISPSGRFLARVEGKKRGNILTRKRQFELFAAPPTLLRQNTVAAKLANSISVIKRTIKDYPLTDADGGLSDVVGQLGEAIAAVYDETDCEAILGIEGNAAKVYFKAFNKLILQQKAEFHFTERSKRPPLDRVNALLSFMYTIFTNEYASSLESVGLDSYMGFYHAPRPGRASLACDLVEEGRCVVERFVLTLINLKIVNEQDFEIQPSGAVFLNTDGKKKVLTRWQEKKRTEIVHPYLRQKMKLGLLPYIQSALLAKYVRGEIDEYPCYLVR